MGRITARVSALMKELSTKRGEDITIERLALETRLAPGTVRKWAKDQVDRYDSDTLATFIDYFSENLGRSVTISDVLLYEKS